MDKKKKLRGNIVFSTNAHWQPDQEENIEENLPPQKQPVKVKLDKKHRAGKTVTVIEGLTMSEKQIEDFSKKLKTLCGSGGSFKENVIIIQGDHTQKIINFLHKEGFILAKKVN